MEATVEVIKFAVTDIITSSPNELPDTENPYK